VVEERLRRILRERVEEYLAGAERLLGSPTPLVGWEVLRERLRPLVAGWRVLLEVHEPHRRRCRHCDRPWWHRGEPCSVWRTANALLVARFPEERRFPQPS